MDGGKCRSLFLIDDTREYTNNYYIFELVKIVLFQEGAFSVSLPDICSKIEEITDMNYTEEEILRALSEMNNNIVECNNNEYSLTEHGEQMMRNRQRNICIDSFVKSYIDTELSIDDKPQKEESINLIYRFVFERFNENIAQIASVLNNEVVVDLPEEKYTEKENKFINGFLQWDNPEKNRLIYELIAKSFDYCMINSKCEKSSLDFRTFIFYLDTNILFRLMGLNNETRKNSVSVFIDKCLSEKITIKVSSFVLAECEKTIEQNIAALIERTRTMTALISPSSMSFAEENSLGSDFYKIYYDWCRNGHKHRNYDGFRKYIQQIFEKATESFVLEKTQISFSISNRYLYEQLFESLYEIKEDRHTVDTDVNSILLTNSVREKGQSPDTYLISADKTLISWVNETFKTYKNIVDYPSAWLSILLKFTGREKVDDYKSFCQFIHLPIAPEPEPDLKKKIDIKTSIMMSDFDDRIKDEMIQEIRKNYRSYKEADTEEIIHRAYAKTEKQIIETAKREEAARSNKEHEENLQNERERHEAEIKEIKDAYEKRNEKDKIEVFEKGQTCGKEMVIRNIAKQKSTNHRIIRVVLGIMIIASVVIGFAAFFVLFLSNGLKIKNEWIIACSNIADIVGIVSFVWLIICFGLKMIFGKKELLEVDEEKIYQKIKNKY